MLKRLIRSVLLLCALFVSSQVMAQGCASDSCVGARDIYLLDGITVYGRPLTFAPADWVGYTQMNNGCGLHCGNGANGGGYVAQAATETYKEDTLKKDRRFCIRSNDTCDGWFLSATSRCGSIFQNNAAYYCAIGAEAQRNDSCIGLRAANTC